ncbi:MAG: type IV secretion protein DotA [Alphaproteobacteria bacterium]|nr:type IV secretion protein DotA [Alphaproteobacteria bacterium]
MNITAKRIFKYTVMPGVVPMFRDLAQSGFSNVAFLMAQILNMAKLLPAGHPYLRAVNMGRFGIRHVLAESGRNLTFDRSHIDQIVIYFAILLAFVLLVVQCALLLLSLLVQPALAAMPANYGEFFVTDNPLYDIAFILLDSVFGVPDMFESCVEQMVACNHNPLDGNPGMDASGPVYTSFPSAFHLGLQQLFRLYSITLMIIAVLIFCYFIVTMIGETAQDGTPFGRRFNHVWAPLRMVVALGLLVPIGTFGLNSGQYITLFAAKWGSGFATNAWILFNDTLTGTYLGDQEDLIAQPKIPDLDQLIKFMLVAQTCRHAYANVHEDMAIGQTNEIRPYLVRDPLMAPIAQLWIGTTWDQGVRWSQNRTMVVHWGYQNPEGAPGVKGNVAPLCGALNLPMVDMDEPGAVYLQRFYYTFLQNLYQAFDNDGRIIARRNAATINDPQQAAAETDRYQRIEMYYAQMRIALENGVAIQRASAEVEADALELYGWAGASIWYNKVAQMNGAVTNAVFNIPRPKLWPHVLEKVLKEKQQTDSSFTEATKFDRRLGGDKDTVDFSEFEHDLYEATSDAYKILKEDGGRLMDEHSSTTGNWLVDMINFLLGTEGLMNIRENVDVHPLAQLSAIGKSLIESTIRNLALATGAGIVTVATSSGVTQVASSLLVTFAMIGLTAGFALHYVIPFLPFLYFFFSVGGWIKGIFEAMVGVPLWALAHIRIDGQGLPGDAAVNGYFLIFEVFLRPILMLFGLLGSILIFAAAVRVLNDIWDLVIHNVGGFDLENQADPDLTDIEFYRNAIDQFFFLIIYTIMVYLLGISSFKMVYLVPNNILRWMGASVATFGDQSQDPTEGLMQTVAIGGGSVSSQLSGAAKQGGAAAQGLADMATGRKPT